MPLWPRSAVCPCFSSAVLLAPGLTRSCEILLGVYFYLGELVPTRSGRGAGRSWFPLRRSHTAKPRTTIRTIRPSFQPGPRRSRWGITAIPLLVGAGAGARLGLEVLLALPGDTGEDQEADDDQAGHDAQYSSEAQGLVAFRCHSVLPDYLVVEADGVGLGSLLSPDWSRRP